MKHIGTIILLMLMTVMPMKSWAAHGSEAEGELDIPEIVLEHLADSYEWHIATYEGKHISIPLPIIVRSSQSARSILLRCCPSRQDIREDGRRN